MTKGLYLSVRERKGATRKANMSQAKIKPAENALFATFSGLDTRSAHTGTPSMADIYNFRLTADGSLEKRYGYRHLANLGGDIRAVWSGKLGERFVCVALGGNAVSTVNVNNGEVDVIGNIDSSEGGACFFYHHDRLYLLAGGLYVIDVSEPCVKRSFGYIPLIGKDWGTKLRLLPHRRPEGLYPQGFR